VLLATDVAIWMPACAASPDGTCTNTAGRDAVNALKSAQSTPLKAHTIHGNYN
jgi:hypothetical protein